MSRHVARWMLMLPAFLCGAPLAPIAAWAQGGQLRLQADVEYIYRETESKNQNPESPEYRQDTDTQFQWLKQRYRGEFRKELFPYLEGVGGGYFELIDSRTDTDKESESETIKTGFDDSTLRYYGELNLNNPLLTGNASYRRSKEKEDPLNAPSMTLRREEYGGLARWRPVGLPSLDVDFSHLHAWDREDTRDLHENLLVAKTRYAYDELLVDYGYTRSNQDEKIRQNGALTQVHDGGVRYLQPLFDDRLEVLGAARVYFDQLEPTGEKPLEVPTSPGIAFFFTDAFDSNSYTEVSSANPLSTINIGNNGPLNDVSVGLRFDPPTEVDTIYVYPRLDDQDPTQATPTEIQAVQNDFVWRVETSEDGLNWMPVPGAGAITDNYDAFENRFKFPLPTIMTSRYIRVVVLPKPNQLKEIRLDRIRAFTTKKLAAGQGTESLTQTYNLGLNWTVSDATTATLDSLVQIRRDEPFGSRRVTLTNGVGVQHDFDPTLYGSARLVRTDTLFNAAALQQDAVHYNYSASLAKDYFPSLSQRLVYSGDYEREEANPEVALPAQSGYGNSLFLRTNADVYRNWGVNLDLGYSARQPTRGPSTSDASFRVATTVFPHPTLNLTVDYRGSWETESRAYIGYQQIGRFQAFWVPLRTLSMSAVVGLRDRPKDGRGLLDSQNYSVSWTPFPDGQLTFSFAYNETIDTENVDTKVVTPQIEWQITRSTLLTVSYDYALIDGKLETRRVQQVRAYFRTFY